MADVGLDSELVLDVERALRAVGQVEEKADRATNLVLKADTRQVTSAIEAALASVDTSLVITGEAADVTGDITAAIEAADSSVLVTGETGELTGDITGAVDAADTGVVVTGDATDVTGSIDGAVDAADTAVVVTGNASDVTGSIDGAVQAADTNVEITADTSQAQAQVAAVGTAASTSTGGVLSLRAALAGLTALGVGGLLVEIVNAASDIGESSSKAATVFGDSFGEIERFADDAATAVGLSAEQAFAATGTFGNLFQALGVGQEEATGLSQDVVQLGADLASFNNLEVTDALEKLRSGLVGEIEPLRGLGISFGAADVEARGLALGLADVADQLTEGDKVLARYSLIAEQASLAQGDFARTSDGLANQSRILVAEIGNVAASAGQQLLPTVLELVDMARDELVPRFGELANAVLPALADALLAVAPLAGTFLDVLIAGAPILQVIADVLDSIPTPLLTFAATTFLLTKGVDSTLGPLSTFLSGISQMRPVLAGVASGTTGLPGMVTGLLNLHPAVLAAGVALGAITASLLAAKQRKAEFRAEVREATEALRDEEGVLRTTSDAISKYVEEGSRLGESNQLDDLRRIGLSLGEVADLARDGADGLAEFRRRTIEAGEVDLTGNFDWADLTREQLEELIATGETYVDSQVVALQGNEELIRSFEELQSVVTEAARAELDRLAVAGPAEAAIVAQAEANNLLADGSVDVVAALDETNRAMAALTREQERAAEEAQRVIDTYGPVADQFVGTAEALGRLGETAPEVTTFIRDLRLGTDDTAGAFLDFALAADAAALSEDQWADAAALLGVDVETLRGHVELLAETVATFVDQAVGQLPTVQSVFGEVATAAGETGAVTAAALAEALTNTASELGDFRADLAAITDAGFADLAAIIAEQGPQVGGALADELERAIADGNVEILEGLRGATSAFNNEWSATEEYFRTTLGPQMVLTTGLLGGAITESFGQNLDFAERLRIAAELAATTLDEEGQAIAAVAAVEGDAAAQAYGDALGLDQEVIDASIVAGRAIRENAPVGDARTAGANTGEGFAQGVESMRGRINAAARSAVSGVAAIVARELDIFSPSRVMQKLGEETGEGFALGITDSLPVIDEATSEMAKSVPRVLDGTLKKPGEPTPYDIGTEVGSKFADGIADQAGPAEAAAQAVADAALWVLEVARQQAVDNLAAGIISEADATAWLDELARQAWVAAENVSTQRFFDDLDAELLRTGFVTGPSDAPRAFPTADMTPRELPTPGDKIVFEANAIVVDGRVDDPIAVGQRVADGILSRLDRRSITTHAKVSS